MEDRMLSDEILLGIINAKSGGGGGGTSNYNDLSNKPQIGGTTLSGNKTASDLGLVAAENGKGLSSNDYTDADKAIVGGVTAALAGKQDALTAGKYINIDANNEISVDPVVPNEAFTYTIQQIGDGIVKITKTVSGAVVFEKTYNGNADITLDAIHYVYNAGVQSYTLLIASDTHEAGFKQSMNWWARDTFTENFSTVDHSGEKLIIKSEMDDALALKQDKTDNSLQTTDKTVVGAVNELKSGLTNLDNEVNGDATTYPYADVITIEDAIPANLADCKAKIEPVQDLHGYDHPWVGGAGKNLLPMTVGVIKSENTSGTWSGNTYTLNDVMFTVKTDNDGNVTGIRVNGTASSETLFTVKTSVLLPASTLLRINGGASTVLVRLWTSNWAGSASSNGTDTEFTSQPDGIVRCRLQVESGAVVNDVTVYPMIRLATETDATFAPYTNICPITGHTEASVQRDGRNLCDKGEGNVYNGGKLIPVSAGDKIYCYGEWVSDNKSFYGAIFSTPTETSKGNKIAILDDFYTGVSKEMTISTNGYFGVCFDTSVESYTVSKMMISKTPITSASDYVPYAGKTYTIALGDTIYGGTVDFDSGVMTVDRKYSTISSVGGFNSGNNWAWNYLNDIKRNSNIRIVCDQLKGVSVSELFQLTDGIAVQDKNIVYKMSTLESSAEAYNTYLAENPLHICYELATPFTVQLTPTQIQLLKGTNTLTASTGDISVTVNGVSGSIGAVQTQANATDVALAELADKLPTAPTTDGAYVLTVTVADGTPTYSWVIAT